MRRHLYNAALAVVATVSGQGVLYITRPEAVSPLAALVALPLIFIIYEAMDHYVWHKA